MNYSDLGKRVKEKYPGTYDSIPDDELGSKTAQKHPEYMKMIDTSAPEVNAPSRSLAGDISSIVTPPESAPLPTGLGGWVQRIGRAAKESVMAPISPLLAFGKDKAGQDLAKRMMSPAAGQVGMSQLAQEIGTAGREAGLNASNRVGEMVAESPIANYSPAVAAGLGTVASTVGDIAAHGAILSPGDAQKAAGTEALGISGNMAAEKLEPYAVGAARKALGFTKQHLNSPKSWLESLRKQAQANRAAKMMLDKKAIGVLGDPVDMANNATTVLRQSGEELDNILTALDKKDAVIETGKMASELIDELKPRFEDEQKVAEQIITDLQQFPNGLSLTEAKTLLKKRWGQLGYDKTVGTTASGMYRKATQILENAIKSKVKEFGGKELANAYSTASGTWGDAFTALKGIGNKASQEMGNNLVDLPTNIVAAGQLASGNVPGALATTGILQAMRRRGMAPTAVMLKSLSQGAGQTARTSSGMGIRALIEKSKAKK